jgi:hypothetical protein
MKNTHIHSTTAELNPAIPLFLVLNPPVETMEKDKVNASNQFILRIKNSKNCKAVRKT